MESRAAFRVGGFASFLLLLVGLASISSVAGLKCYSCDEDCETNLGKEQTCGTEDFWVCAKFSGEIDGKKGNFRSCSDFPIVSRGIKMGCHDDISKLPLPKKGKEIKGPVCFCNSDLCNGYIKQQASSIMILITALTTLLWYVNGASASP